MRRKTNTRRSMPTITILVRKARRRRRHRGNRNRTTNNGMLRNIRPTQRFPTNGSTRRLTRHRRNTSTNQGSIKVLNMGGRRLLFTPVPTRKRNGKLHPSSRRIRYSKRRTTRYVDGFFRKGPFHLMVFPQGFRGKRISLPFFGGHFVLQY